MRCFVGLSLMAGVLFTCMAASSGQAAPISTSSKLATASQSSGIISQVYWRGRHYYRGRVYHHPYRAHHRHYYRAHYHYGWCGHEYMYRKGGVCLDARNR